MTIGIHSYRDPKQVCQLPGMLMLPMTGDVKGYAINRREWSDLETNEEKEKDI